jgi:phage shock protein C
MSYSGKRYPRLYRSRRDSILFGVCGGIAEAFDLSPWGVRLMFIILEIFLPMMFLVYIVMALIMKKAPRHQYGIYERY